MKIKFTTSMAGAFWTHGPGDEAHLPEDEAQRLVEAGYAVPVKDVVIEKAVLPNPVAETATVIAKPKAK